ncbi:MAG: glycosyltransferase family 4 protein [Anaerolineae bacterium]
MSSLRRIVMVGPFGLQPRMTMRVRALPLAKALVALGHEVILLLPPWQNPEDAGKTWEDEGVRVENVDLPQAVPGWFQWRLSSYLVRRIKQIDPDVIHAFKPKAYAGLVHVALTRRYPVVVDTDDWEGPGGWNVLGDYTRWMRWFFTRQERWGLTHAEAVTVASRALQTLTWALGGPPDRVFYLPNGAILPEVDGLSSNQGRPTLLLYTRFFEYDVGRLWRIVKSVRDRRPEIRLLVVGKGFAGEETWLLQLARDAGWRVVTCATELPDADLVYAGWGTEKNLPVCFAAADLGIYPFDDNLLNRTKCPMKLMDQLAAGIPIVADAVGEITEMVVEGETGLLVRPGDVRGFVEAILTLVADPGRLQRMAEAARADVAHRYAWSRLATQAEAAYHRASHGD